MSERIHVRTSPSSFEYDGPTSQLPVATQTAKLKARIAELEKENTELRHDIERYIQHNTELLNSKK